MPAEEGIRDQACAMYACRAMDEKGIAVFEKLRKFWHRIQQTIMHFTFGILAVGEGNPYPFDTSHLSHVAVARRAFAFFEQSNEMRASHLL